MHRTGEMLFILKTLLLAPSSKKLDVYQTQFRTVFKGREPLFDELLAVIGTFYNAYQEFPDPNELLERLQAEGHIKQADYLSNLLSGTLTAAEEDFFFHVADYDLRNNPRPGTLYIDQPNKSKFRLSDLHDSLLALEATMPVHCCVVDYITLMYPLESERIPSGVAGCAFHSY
jgi:hypothetical protein